MPETDPHRRSMRLASTVMTIGFAGVTGVILLVLGTTDSRSAPPVAAADTDRGAVSAPAAFQAPPLEPPVADAAQPREKAGQPEPPPADGSAAAKPDLPAAARSSRPTYEQNLRHVQEVRIPRLAVKLMDTGQSFSARSKALRDLIQIETDMPSLGVLEVILSLDRAEATDLTGAALLGNAARDLALLGSSTALAAVTFMAGSTSERARLAIALALIQAKLDGRIRDERVDTVLAGFQQSDPSTRVRELIASRMSSSRK